jgi:L-aminopeptidase/D-esterase-like protein
LNLGAAAFDNAKDGTMLIGRVGAGTSTTANKISGNLIWGGQGAAHKEVVGPKGEVFNIFTAVILNPHGDVTLPKGLGIDKKQLHALRGTDVPKGHKQNTTLSIVVTDLKLDRNQLRRLSMMVHTGMAAMIHPFHSYTDGDICFSVSTNKVDLPRGEEPGELEELLQGEASRLMKQAMVSSIKTANNAAGSKKATP